MAKNLEERKNKKEEMARSLKEEKRKGVKIEVSISKYSPFLFLSFKLLAPKFSLQNEHRESKRKRAKE